MPRARAGTEQGTLASDVVFTWLRYCLIIVMVLSDGGDDIAISHSDHERWDVGASASHQTSSIKGWQCQPGNCGRTLR